MRINMKTINYNQRGVNNAIRTEKMGVTSVQQNIRILPMLRVILEHHLHIRILPMLRVIVERHLHIRLLQTQQVIVEHRSLTHLQQMRQVIVDNL